MPCLHGRYQATADQSEISFCVKWDEESIMSEERNMEEMLGTFSDVLYESPGSIEACDQNASQAITLLADALAICEMRVDLTAPATKLRQKAIEHRVKVLYQSGEQKGTPAFETSFTFADGGTLQIHIDPYSGRSFSQKKERMLLFLSREIFSLYNRLMMKTMVEQITTTDMETGVKNPSALMQYAGRLFAMGNLSDYTIVFFNVHNFKYVNKVFSYAEGDVILRKYAQLIQSYLTDKEVLARLGGDNFLALVKAEHAEEFLKKIQDVRLHFRNEQREKCFILGVTAGYSSLEGISHTREIMARASLAYQQARKQGAGSAVGYSEKVRQELMEDQSVLSDFIPALEAEEFVVYYQPKVNIKDKSLYGAEALVRWQRGGQLIPPGRFVPVLERDGSICQLDYYVLRKVCQLLQKWKAQGKELLCISVNFSRKHLEEENMVERIADILDMYEIPHDAIEIELTESEDYQNYEIMTGIVNALSEKGINTSMDDFGTGFSSLSMIKNLDLNVIKIDKSLIPLDTAYADREKDRIMFNHIVALISQLGKKTIAEGVETAEQLEYLKEAGCDIVQGYIFDKPLPQDLFEKRCENGYE